MLIVNEGMIEEGFSKFIDEEIVGQCVIFFFVGYEILSNIFVFIMYYLVIY